MSAHLSPPRTLPLPLPQDRKAGDRAKSPHDSQELVGLAQFLGKRQAPWVPSRHFHSWGQPATTAPCATPSPTTWEHQRGVCAWLPRYPVSESTQVGSHRQHKSFFKEGSESHRTLQEGRVNPHFLLQLWKCPHIPQESATPRGAWACDEEEPFPLEILHRSQVLWAFYELAHPDL